MTKQPNRGNKIEKWGGGKIWFIEKNFFRELARKKKELKKTPRLRAPGGVNIWAI